MGVFMKVSIKHKAPVKMFKLTLCMMCLVVMYGVQGGKLSEQESFLTRVKRASCDPEGAKTCAEEATKTYLSAMFDENQMPKAVPAGEKPDYQERKTCNFLLETEKCFEKLDNCGLPAAKLQEIKDKSFQKARDAAKKLPNWQDEKCQSEVSDQKSSDNVSPTPEPGNSAAALGTSLLMVFVIAVFVSKI